MQEVSCIRISVISNCDALEQFPNQLDILIIFGLPQFGCLQISTCGKSVLALKKKTTSNIFLSFFLKSYDINRFKV